MTVLAQQVNEQTDAMHAPDFGPANPNRPCDSAASDMQKVMDARLSLLVKLEGLDHIRHQLLQQADLPADVKEELDRQSRELRHFPSVPTVQTVLADLQNRLIALKNPGAEEPHPLLLQAMDLGRRQCAIFLERDHLIAPLLRHAAAMAADEPLFAFLAEAGSPPHQLFGWAVYIFAVHEIKLRATLRRNALREHADELSQNQCDQFSQLEIIIQAASRELGEVEPAAVKAFWDAYEMAASLLAGGKVASRWQACVRAFLRYGMIGVSERFLPPATAHFLLDECAHSIEKLDESPDATHVFYADEYIELVARGQITPSLDEDLELNHRRSSRWMRDKCWRRVISARLRSNAIQQTIARIESQIIELEQDSHQAEMSLAIHANATREGLKLREQLRQRIQDNRVGIARRTRAVERMRGKLLGEEKARSETALDKLKSLGGPPNPVELACEEARQLHRVCCLCAKLKDPFLPLLLRHNLHLDNGLLNDRAKVLQALDAIEQKDPAIFKETVVHSNKQVLRTYVRYSPYVVLAPSCGFMGFSWNPRGATEVGRIVLPVYNQRPGLLDIFLTAAIADFRWDSSRESAGLDVLTSDTLVAAYSTVRWDYRKRSPDVRRKAGIYSEETDRKNWRRHYALYLSSAMEGGRKLFFKCRDIYDAIVKYMDLPAGVKKLKQ